MIALLCFAPALIVTLQWELKAFLDITNSMLNNREMGELCIIINVCNVNESGLSENYAFIRITPEMSISPHLLQNKNESPK